MIAILPPITPIAANATDAERKAAYLRYVEELKRSNPRHSKMIDREVVKAMKGTR